MRPLLWVGRVPPFLRAPTFAPCLLQGSFPGSRLLVPPAGSQWAHEAPAAAACPLLAARALLTAPAPCLSASLLQLDPMAVAFPVCHFSYLRGHSGESYMGSTMLGTEQVLSNWTHEGGDRGAERTGRAILEPSCVWAPGDTCGFLYLPGSKRVADAFWNAPGDVCFGVGRSGIGFHGVQLSVKRAVDHVCVVHCLCSNKTIFAKAGNGLYDQQAAVH